MRVITHCPVCQTQFFATEEQLNKHGGKVRCGQCMHVFDAKAQLVTVATDQPEKNSTTDSITSAQIITHGAASDATVDNVSQHPDSSLRSDSNTENIARQPSDLGDVIKKKRFNTKRFSGNSRRWLWLFFSLLLILTACAQSIYFLRDQIAIYYPNIKPYLVKACQRLSCSINLPRQIEFIVIDDSDMQEDPDHSGVIHFSSNLMNTGSHTLAYPDLELTLTDVDDKPVLRRIFKPHEYLPPDRNITDGIRASEEIRIKLAITTANIAVAGYRVFVTY